MSMGSFGLKSDLFHFRHNRFLKQVSYTCFLLLFLLLLAAPVSIANALQPVGTRYVTTTGSDASVDCTRLSTVLLLDVGNVDLALLLP